MFWRFSSADNLHKNAASSSASHPSVASIADLLYNLLPDLKLQPLPAPNPFLTQPLL